MSLFSLGLVLTIVVSIPAVGLLYYYAGWSAFVGIGTLCALIPMQVCPSANFGVQTFRQLVHLLCAGVLRAQIRLLSAQYSRQDGRPHSTHQSDDSGQQNHETARVGRVFHGLNFRPCSLPKYITSRVG